MRLVAKCSDCGEQKILEEWMRCKSCFRKWFVDALDKPDYLTDNDTWYVIPPKRSPMSVAEPCNHKSIPENLDCTNDFHGPQLDPAKVDKAIAACGAAKDAAKMAKSFTSLTLRARSSETFTFQPNNDPAPPAIARCMPPVIFGTTFSERSAKAQRELNNTIRDISRKLLSTKNLPPTKP